VGSVAGAVLTGGAGRRMGGRKPFVEYRGEALGSRVAAALRDAGCAPVVAVGGPRDDLAALGLDVIDDRWPGEGPLGGVVTAGSILLDSATPAMIVAACDLGRLDASSVSRLLAVDPGADLVVARGARRHPSLMRCSLAALKAATVLFGRGERRLMRLAEEDSITVVACDLDEDVLVNVNSPGDLER
jgi:molybdopterin-guanine dinucleotide biosynthesis protein A